MSELHVFKNDCDWVIAASEADAVEVWCEAMGERLDDYADDENLGFKRIDDDKDLTIWCDRGTGEPSEIDGDGCDPITKPCRDWVQRGRGHLGTTEQ